MCGIAGAIGRIEPAVIEAVDRMSDALAHRGPDDSGAWTSTGPSGGNGVAFGFRRLSIIDLSAEAHQPMIDEATGNVIMFNGEIYNFQQLRQELERDGVQFHSRSDTEVLLKAYGKWGLDAVNRLRGMFAFAIWDAKKQQAILVRDRVGIKPLYTCRIERSGGSMVLFASELRALLASGLLPRKLNPVALSTYAWNGFVIGPETMVQGARALGAGTMSIVGADGLQIEARRYWRIPNSRVSPDGVERLREQLATSVQQHLVSDVPLGIFLSGGIDSSSITSLAVRAAGSSVQTFTLGFDEKRFDESPYAAAVAHALGAQHQVVRLTQNHFQELLPEALASIDQPTFDAINTFYMSRAVREMGITVVLTGAGGDEVFGGYRSFVELPKVSRVCRMLSWMPTSALRGLGRSVARMKLGRYGEVPPQTRWGKLGDALATRGRLLDLYQIAAGLFTSDFTEQLLADGSHPDTHNGLPNEILPDLDAVLDGNPQLHSISALELKFFAGERLMRDIDSCSMAVSLEARVPLLDHEVIEAAATVDTTQRFIPAGEKDLERILSMGQLDVKLFDRPKSGFTLPIEVWCREQLKGEVEATLSDKSLCAAAGLDHATVGRLWQAFQAGAPGMYWSRVWALFVLLWWCREHRVSL